jgi:hypothetical protein
VTLAPGELETFEIYVRTEKQDCTFTFEMSVTTPTGVVVETISDNGKPYELTGVANTADYQDLYLGGANSLDSSNSLNWIQADPKTYH